MVITLRDDEGVFLESQLEDPAIDGGAELRRVRDENAELWVEVSEGEGRVDEKRKYKRLNYKFHRAIPVNNHTPP